MAIILISHVNMQCNAPSGRTITFSHTVNIDPRDGEEQGVLLEQIAKICLQGLDIRD